MADIAVLSKGFRISIPKDVRDAQDWRPGQRFAFLPRGDSLLLVPVPNREDLAGIVKGATAGRYRDRRDRF
jgi:AbrB family looped-hinge helix DNA binding protein